SLSMRPYMCTPQAVQAWRLMVAFGSTTLSFDSFAVTFTLSFATTATWENNAPFGFQHFVHPQTWLCAIWAPIDTVTCCELHLHLSVPPAKFFAAGFKPPSTAG